MDELKMWAEKYVEVFNEPFPAYELSGIPEPRKIAMLKEAIDKKEALEFYYEDDRLY